VPKTDGRSLARLDRETVPASASCVLSPYDGIDHGLYAPCMVKNSIMRRPEIHGRLLHGALSSGACCGQSLRRVLARCATCIVPTDHGRPRSQFGMTFVIRSRTVNNKDKYSIK